MPKKCLNRKCILQNFALNLFMNNIISGMSSIFKAKVQGALSGFALLGVGVLLLVGVWKENRSLILTFLILEPFLLTYESVKLFLLFRNNEEETGLFDILAVVGIVVSWILLYPVYLFYKDLCEKESMQKIDNECKENGDNGSVKNAVV